MKVSFTRSLLRLRLTVFWLLSTLLSGCTSLYFHDAGAAPAPVRYSLKDWPYQEYWTGLVFNGSKIGFAHLTLETGPGSDETTIHSEAALRFRLLGYDKRVNLRTTDRVGSDLRLLSLEYDQQMDASRLRLRGEMRDGRLHLTTESGGQIWQRTLDPEGPLYPVGVVNLYPVLHGLEPGRDYRYLVFDGETRSIAEVEQRVLAYETSELFEGPAYRLETSLHGQKVTTWIDARGLPQFELSLNGVLIAALEPAERARDYLLKAALIKDDTLLHYSRIPVQPPLESARDSRRMKLLLEGIDAQRLGGLDAPGQECRVVEDLDVLCSIRRIGPGSGSAGAAGPEDLASTLAIPSGSTRIRRLAEEITAGAGEPTEAIRRILDWMSDNLEQAAADSFSALDVLDHRKAECQGHSFLYASLARARGIPTRVVNGLVYHPDYQGFLYHTWAESLLQGSWVPVDPTFRQLGADATHVRLLVGEDLADLLPLLDVIGSVKVQVLELE